MIGALVTSLWVRLRGANEAHRALALAGGTLFVTFFSTAMTLWAAPLLENESLNVTGAEAYLLFDDVGWVLLGLAGISIGAMIVGVSLAALDLALLPKWAGWASLALGVVSLATVALVGLFAWTIWLIAATLFRLLRSDRGSTSRSAAETSERPASYCASAFSGPAGEGGALRAS